MRRQIDAHATGRKVLIVDDHPMMRALIAATLSPESYELLEAEAGSEALDLIIAEHPRLVILDERMPPPDGFEVCRRIKADPMLSDVLVLMVTGDPQDEPLALSVGADGYLGKPFSPLQLLEVVAQLVDEDPIHASA